MAIRRLPSHLRTLRRPVRAFDLPRAEAEPTLAAGDVLLAHLDAHRGHLLVRPAPRWRLQRSAGRHWRVALRGRHLLHVRLLAPRESALGSRRRSEASAQPSPPPNTLSDQG